VSEFFAERLDVLKNNILESNGQEFIVPNGNGMSLYIGKPIN
jgi:hypothetical protein